MSATVQTSTKWAIHVLDIVTHGNEKENYPLVVLDLLCNRKCVNDSREYLLDRNTMGKRRF